MADQNFTWRSDPHPNATWHCFPAGRPEPAALCGEPAGGKRWASDTRPERPHRSCPACEQLAAERGIR
jgi:hypothetical protein